MPTPRPLRLVAGLAVPLLLLSGCGEEEQGPADRERSADTDVAFTGCDEAACTGEIDGAAFEIVLPETWNGTLLLYSHGYRQAQAAPPDFDEPSTEPEPAPGWSSGDEGIGRALLEQGYALAGSAYASNGWAVAEGVEAGEALHEHFVDEVGAPDRTYLWGDSLGGLITQVMAERNPDWVTAAAPLCGVLAGPVPNLDLALDVAYGVRTLLAPELQLSGYDSWDDATAEWERGFDAVVAAGGDVAVGVPRLLAVAALTDGPSQTRTYDGATVESQVRAKAEAALTALGYGTYGRYDIEQRFGGNPSGNDDVDYADRIDAEERSLIDTVGGAGTTDALLAELEEGDRLTADAGARDALAASGTPTGALQDKTITLHTTADPLVLVQNEAVFADRVRASTERTGDLVQLYSLPPAAYDAEEGAPYGAGHCNFTSDERLGVISLLDGWARSGVYPGAAAVEAAFSGDSGVAAGYVPPAWPEDLEE